MVRPGHGGNLDWAAEVAGCEPSMLLDFSASISPLGPPQSIVQGLHDQMGAVLAAYPSPGYGELRASIGQHHGLGAEWVLPGNGAAELLTWAARDLADCRRVYLKDPGFGDYARSLRASGARVESLPLDVELLFDAELGWLGDEPRGACEPLNWPALTADDGIVINNPHNPTGYLFSAESLRSLLAQGGLVVVDEAFMDFLPPERQQSVVGWVQAFPNLVVLRSLTKFYSLAGLRLGYALLHPDRAQRWQRWRDPWPVNSLAAIAGQIGLRDKAFQRKTWTWLPEARRTLLSGLQDLPGLDVYPGSANFLLVRSQVSCTQLQTQLLKKYHILIRDCMSFPALGDRFFRVAVRRSEDHQRLLTALGTILAEIQAEQGLAEQGLAEQNLAEQDLAEQDLAEQDIVPKAQAVAGETM